MACNNSDCGQWPRQEAIVGAAASKMRATAKQMLGAATRYFAGKAPRWPAGEATTVQFLHGYGFILPQDDRAISRAVRCPVLAGTGCAGGNAVCKGLLYCPVHSAAQFPGAIG